MTSFSSTRPLAFHAFPLTAARDVLSGRALDSKRHLGPGGVARRTTRDVDRALGFDDFVQLYLPQASTRFEDLPILGAQLAPARHAAVPHAVVALDTSSLSDEECTLCNWNIAVSRPGVEGVFKGGNWTRGTNFQRIAEVWDAFRISKPSVKRARGFWAGPKVPVIPGEHLREHARLFASARRIPKLLLRSRVALGKATVIHVFSNADADSISALCSDAGLELQRSDFEGYSDAPDPLNTKVRTRLNAHLMGTGAPPDIDFDRQRG